jgi:hypothetical protein
MCVEIPKITRFHIEINLKNFPFRPTDYPLSKNIKYVEKKSTIYKKLRQYSIQKYIEKFKRVWAYFMYVTASTYSMYYCDTILQKLRLYKYFTNITIIQILLCF